MRHNLKSVGIGSLVLTTLVVGADSTAAQGFSSARGSASARASAHAGGVGQGFSTNPQQQNQRFGRQPFTQSSASASRSVSVAENGKRISVSEDDSGIRVTINDREVRAANVAALKEKDPEAHRVYEKYLGSSSGKAGFRSPASDLLQKELRKLRDKHADDPQLLGLIENMLREIDK